MSELSTLGTHVPDAAAIPKGPGHKKLVKVLDDVGEQPDD